MMMLRVIVLASALALVKAAPNTSRNLASRELGRDDRSSPSSPQCESDSTMAALDQGRSLAIRAHNFFRANTELASHGLTSRPMRQPFFFWAAYVPPFGTTGSLYLDNHKCASTSIRNLLGSVLSERCHAHCFNAICNVSAGHPCHNLFVPPSAAYTRNPHMSPETLTAARIRKAAPFIWTMVRDPVSKFNSGVFQVKLKDKRLRNMTADDILDKLLGAEARSWMQVHPITFGHLESNLAHFFEQTEDGIHVIRLLDYIGKVEDISRGAWDAVACKLGIQSNLPHDREEKQPSDFLSSNGIRRLCGSALYKYDWPCFGYPVPKECTGS